jgi:hypothetical protein
MSTDVDNAIDEDQEGLYELLKAVMSSANDRAAIFKLDEGKAEAFMVLLMKVCCPQQPGLTLLV